MSDRHPIAGLKVVSYERQEDESVFSKWIARFDHNSWPIIFSGSTRDEALEKAETFRAETIEKNEAAYIRRTEALEKARAARERKAAENE